MIIRTKGLHDQWRQKNRKFSEGIAGDHTITVPTMSQVVFKDNDGVLLCQSVTATSD